MYVLQPYRRDPDIRQFHASGRAGRRNAVTEEEASTVAAAVAQSASHPDASDDSDTNDDSSTSTRDVSNTHIAETKAAGLPADLSKLKFTGEDL